VTDLPIAPDVAALATHGSYCPKLCNHTCPVLRATGRNDAVPWGFHRTVADLADGRLGPADAADRLVACSGCGACAEGCTFDDQDVPAQVRAGRATVHAAGASHAAVAAASDAVAAGRSPYGTAEPRLRPAHVSGTVVLGGCRDEPGVLAAAMQLLAAAGIEATATVPEGCCGAVLGDLGDLPGAAAARARLPLDGAERVVLLDPHCRAEVGAAAPEAEVVDLSRLLADLVAAGDLQLDRAPDVAWHEPCLLVDGPAAGTGSALLTGAGAMVELAGEAHRGCTGGGLGLPLLDPVAADAVAAQRRRELGDSLPVVTGCSGAVASLAAAGADVHHLAVVLASLLDTDPETVA